jgi:hypothetical protein
MTRARIFTGEFWTRRVDALTDHVARMVRTGAQAVIVAVGQDLAEIDVFDANWRTIAGAFTGGCIAWVITTLAAPPRA